MMEKKVVRGFSGIREIDYHMESDSYAEISEKTKERFRSFGSFLPQKEVKYFINENLVNWNHKYQQFYKWEKSFRAAVKDIIDMNLEELGYDFNNDARAYLKKLPLKEIPHPEFEKLESLMISTK